MHLRIIVILALLSYTPVQASHLVGAQIYYDCLGGGQYHITLVLYRNCSSSCSACAPYGNPEYVQIFDTAGNYIDSVALPLPTRDTTTMVNNVPCFSANSICTEVAHYQGTITLPYKAGGYYLVYQRCCRSSLLTNVIANTGSTYFTFIPDSLQLPSCDSKPRFNLFTAAINPIDTPFSFDMSATDPDGDSLVYRLTYAYDGANSTCPDPSPASGGVGPCPVAASPPPYLSVNYITPYSYTNPTNNPSDSGNLHIDPYTGMLSGKVNQSGGFLIAVSVDEYRAGVYIGTTFTDYQMLFEGCDTIPKDTANAIRTISTGNAVRIHSLGNTAMVSFPQGSGGQSEISFYDLLGRRLSSDSYIGNMYTKRFEGIATEYLIVKVQLPDGSEMTGKVLIDNGY